MDSYERSRASLHHGQSQPYLPSNTTVDDSNHERGQNYNTATVTRRNMEEQQDRINYSLRKPEIIQFKNDNVAESNGSDSLQCTPMRYMTPLPQDDNGQHRSHHNYRTKVPPRELNTLPSDNKSLQTKSALLRNPHRIPNQMTTHQVPQEKYQELNHYQSRNTTKQDAMFNPLEAEHRLPHHLRPADAAMMPLRKKSRSSKSKTKNHRSDRSKGKQDQERISRERRPLSEAGDA